MLGEQRDDTAVSGYFGRFIYVCKKGDLLSIPGYLDRAELRRKEYAAFVERVYYLARTFRVDMLERFLKHYL